MGQTKPTWLFVIPWDLHDAAGVNQAVINLFHECERSGRYRPLVLIPDWSATEPRYETESGCRVVRLRIRPLQLSAKGLLTWPFLAPFELSRLRRLLRDEAVQIVNWHYPSESTFPFALLRLLRLMPQRLILSFHGADLPSFAPGLRGAIGALIIREASAATACSESLATSVRTVLSRPDLPIRVVYNGIDVERTIEESNVDPPPGLPTGRYLLNVATFERKKGQDVLVRAFGAVCNDYPDVKLVCLGPDTGERGTIEKLVSAMGLEDRVVLLPAASHSRVLAACRHALAFVLPSRQEPFGLVAIEAGALGKAVVASRVGGLQEIINDEVSGLLVDAGDVDAFAAAMRRILADDELRSRLARGLNLRVARDFGWRSSFESLRLAAADGAQLDDVALSRRAA